MTLQLPGSLMLVACAVVSAHDMYLMPSNFRPAKGASVTIGFHTGDSFPESEVGGKIERLKNPRILWENGSAPIINLHAEGNRNVGEVQAIGTGSIIAAASTTPTFIELEATKFLNYLKEEGLTSVIEWRAQHSESDKPGKERYSKYAKSLLVVNQPTGFFQHRAGYVIEIIPEANPSTMKPGDELPIQVLFRRRPAADLQIEMSWAGATGGKTTVAGRTGADGRLRIPVTSSGKWRLHTIKMERCADPAAAEWESFWASLTFEIVPFASQANR